MRSNIIKGIIGLLNNYKINTPKAESLAKDILWFIFDKINSEDADACPKCGFPLDEEDYKTQESVYTTAYGHCQEISGCYECPFCGYYEEF